MKRTSSPNSPARLAVLLAWFGCAWPVFAADVLSPAQFANPPLAARPGAYWPWLNGSVDLATLTSELEEAKAKGMSGLEIWDVLANSDPGKVVPAGPAFLGEESVRAIRHALREGKRLGLRLGLVASSGWNAGGAWVTPDWAQKQLYSSAHAVKGPGLFAGILPFPVVPKECPKQADGRPQYFREVAVLAVPKNTAKTVAGLASVLNLGDHFQDGRLSWNVPDGEWVILRFICSNNGQRLIVPSPNSDGLHIDFLEPAATRRHFQTILDRLGITPENAAQSGLSWLELDSMELGAGIPWTDRFPEYFQKWCGYDLVPCLPILAGWKITGVTEAFRYDHQKALSEQLIFSHYTSGREFLERYGLQLVAEAGGPGAPIWESCALDALKALGNVSVPRGEFWIRHRNMFLVKEIASAAHIYGGNLVSAESFTTWRRWKDGPFALKQLADRALCEGLNQFVFHTFTHSPPAAGLPGRAYHAGADLNPRATWWADARPFIDYLSRCSYMLQRGLFVADVCGYYGDQSPNFWPAFHDVPRKPVFPGLDPGYDYDIANSDVIINRMRVQGGRWTLPDGHSYRLLVLPAQDHIPAEVLDRIAVLVRAGGVVLGPKPARDPRLADQTRHTARVRELAEELWGSEASATALGRPVGAGKVFAGLTPSQALAVLGVPPDFTCARPPAGLEIDFIHRRTAAEDLYFVRNSGTNGGLARCRFRVPGQLPEIWDPATGRTGLRLAGVGAGEGIQVDLPLAPGGSLFVVFRPPVAAPGPVQALARPVAWEGVEGAWTVRFAEGWGAPGEVPFPTLKPWTDFAEEGIKYFSGTAAYHRLLELSAEKLHAGLHAHLDLGEVRELAEVILNGQSLGVLWKPPFRVDLTPVARAGKNELIVKVTNLWINRLVGDLQTKGRRYARTNQQPWTWTYGGDESWREQASGLLGPVQLLWTAAGDPIWEDGGLPSPAPAGH